MNISNSVNNPPTTLISWWNDLTAATQNLMESAYRAVKDAHLFFVNKSPSENSYHDKSTIAALQEWVFDPIDGMLVVKDWWEVLNDSQKQAVVKRHMNRYKDEALEFKWDWEYAYHTAVSIHEMYREEQKATISSAKAKKQTGTKVPYVIGQKVYTLVLFENKYIVRSFTITKLLITSEGIHIVNEDDVYYSMGEIFTSKTSLAKTLLSKL